MEETMSGMTITGNWSGVRIANGMIRCLLYAITVDCHGKRCFSVLMVKRVRQNERIHHPD